MAQSTGEEARNQEDIEHLDKHILHRPETLETARLLDGLEIGLGLTGIVQGSAGAEAPVGEDRTDASWSVDLEVETPVAEHGTAFLLAESRDGAGLTENLATLHGVNADAVDDHANIKITEAWYEHAFSADRFLVTIGKVDLTNYFDTNAVANDETLQFLANGFVNNIALEFPEDNGPGLRLAYLPNDRTEIGFGLAAADADLEGVGRDLFAILEFDHKIAFRALAGGFRLYAWVNSGATTARTGSRTGASVSAWTRPFMNA